MADQKVNVVINAQDNASSKMAAFGDNIQKTLNKVSAVATATLATFGYFTAKIVTNFADAGEQISNFSKKTGLTAESASALKMAADEMGLSITDVGFGIRSMQKALEGMSDDAGKAKEALSPLGLQFKDLKGLLPEDQFIEIGNAISKIEDPSLRTTKAMQLLGKSGVEMIPLFKEGKLSMQELKNEAKRLGVSFDQVALDKALKLDDSLDKLKTTANGLKMTIASSLAPAVTKLVDQLQPLIQKVGEWIAKNPELALRIAEIGTAILGLMAVAGPLLSTIKLISVSFLFLASNPIVLVIGACFALGLAIAQLINNWDELYVWVKYNWTYIYKFIEASKVLINAALDGIVIAIMWLINAFDKVVYATMHTQETWDALVTWVKENWPIIYKIVGVACVFIEGAVDGVIESTRWLMNSWDWLSEKTSAVFLMIAGWIIDGTRVALNSFKDLRENGISVLIDWWDGLKLAVSDVFSSISTTIAEKIASVKGFISGLIDSIQSAINKLSEFVGISSYKSGTPDYIRNQADAARAQAAKYKASGGSVDSGKPYIVGEEGMELFVPSQSGTIIPNGTFVKPSNGGGGTTIVNNISGIFGSRAVEELGNMLAKKLMSHVAV